MRARVQPRQASACGAHGLAFRVWGVGKETLEPLYPTVKTLNPRGAVQRASDTSVFIFRIYQRERLAPEGTFTRGGTQSVPDGRRDDLSSAPVRTA
jgi:hypothetical protein